MAMGKIYIGQKLIILLYMSGRKKVSRKKKKNFVTVLLDAPKLKRVL